MATQLRYESVDPFTIALAVSGLVFLVGGADVLVRGASGLAKGFGLSPLVIGLTVVAYGTSMPELAVSTAASLQGQADVALGNVVGSNIFNVLFILGVSALITPLAVAWTLVWLDVWVMVGASVLVVLLGADGRISRIEGLALFAGCVAYTGWLLWQSRRNGAASQERSTSDTDLPPVWRSVAQVVIGLVLLVIGAKWLVDGAVLLARLVGVSELVIGLTIIAAGTSLPEVAASVAASLRGERDIAVGNVVGSNIFNILAVLGGSAAISSAGVAVSASALAFDVPVMVAVAVACLPVFFTGHRIDRWEGILFLGYYVAYIVYLALDATRSEALGSYRLAMIWFALPLTVVTLATVTVRYLRAGRRDTER
jgi:cation:H+ antiporter